MRFENVQRIVAGLEDVFQDMKYTWIDSHGIIHRQQSTFRVNCMDCLDRTNVCQVKYYSSYFHKHYFTNDSIIFIRLPLVNTC